MSSESTVLIEPETETRPGHRSGSRSGTRVRVPVTRPEEASETKPKKLPPYRVVMHNDRYNGMDYVVGVLKKVFGFSTAKAIRKMLEVHFRGKAAMWTGPKEHAEFKRDQIRACGADPVMSKMGAKTLGVSIEPAA